MQSAAAIRQVSASVIESTDAMILTQFVHEPTKPAKMAFADDVADYVRLNRADRQSMHSVKEFINSVVHNIGVGPKWTTLNRGCVRLLGGVISACWT